MKHWLLMACPLLVLAGNATAADSKMEIQGTIVAGACKVDDDTVNKVVQLPKTQAHSLVDAGTGSDWVDFNLTLSQCPAYMTSATAKFSGTPDTDDNTTYKNTGDAKHVSLQLAARTTIYGNGSSMKVSVDSASHSAEFPLSARMYTAKGGVTLGSFAAVVGVDFTYQ